HRHDDVSFGLSIAGRDGSVRGIDRMVGLTLNNLPVRVRVAPEARVGPWLRELHDAQADVQQYAFSPLHRVQEWSKLPWRRRLFAWRSWGWCSGRVDRWRMSWPRCPNRQSCRRSTLRRNPTSTWRPARPSSQCSRACGARSSASNGSDAPTTSSRLAAIRWRL